MTDADAVLSDLNVRAPETLVTYDAPIPLSLDERKRSSSGPAPESKSAARAPASNLDDVLHSILPPREFLNQDKSVADNEKYVQYVSKKPSSREDVMQLRKRLDHILGERQARPSGICPVREDIYSQAFDELIRHITIECPERGLLLMRTRDEIRMTIDAYKTLYDSSITFGMRKQLQSDHGMSSLESKAAELEAKKISLENQVTDLKYKVEVIEKRAAELRALDQKKQSQEVDFLKYQSEHLEGFLKSVKAKSGIK